jgi:hypothetical protein
MKGADLDKIILSTLKGEKTPITFWVLSQKVMILSLVTPDKADALRQRVYRAVWKLSDTGLVEISESKYKNKLMKYEVKAL